MNEPLPTASSGVSRKRDKFLSNHSSPQQSCEVFWFNNKTESYYNKKRAEFRAKQKELNKKMEKLNFADEEYASRQALLRDMDSDHDRQIQSLSSYH